jgi:hypothetical protein
MAQLSERAQEAAKENTYHCTHCCEECELLNDLGQCDRKDSIALFYDPVLAERAERLREQLKDVDELYQDRIRVALKWEQAVDNVLETAQLLAQAGRSRDHERLRLEDLPRGYLYKIGEMIETWRREGKLYLPHMAWMISRLREDLKWKGKPELAQRIMLQLYRFSELRISSLHIPIAWIDLLTRGGGQNE